MSEAKAMKLREYGTDTISHKLCYANNAELSTGQAIRLTDTYKSRVMEQEAAEANILPRAGFKNAIKVHENAREGYLQSAHSPLKFSAHHIKIPISSGTRSMRILQYRALLRRIKKIRGWGALALLVPRFWQSWWKLCNIGWSSENSINNPQRKKMAEHCICWTHSGRGFEKETWEGWRYFRNALRQRLIGLFKLNVMAALVGGGRK